VAPEQFETTEAAMNATDVTNRPWAPTREVMVVDDDDDVRESIAETLETVGYVVVRAADGLDALGHLRLCGLPELIVLDLMMPRVNGWELCDIVRGDPALAAIPILVITAAEHFDREAVRIEGIRGSLAKPIDPDELLHRVFELVDIGNGRRAQIGEAA
jgi:CheY-like chemotaxis protein